MFRNVQPSDKASVKCHGSVRSHVPVRAKSSSPVGRSKFSVRTKSQRRRPDCRESSFVHTVTLATTQSTMPLGANMPIQQTSSGSISYFCWYFCKLGVLQRDCKVRNIVTVHLRGQSQSWRSLQLISWDIPRLRNSAYVRAFGLFCLSHFSSTCKAGVAVTVIFCLSCADRRSPVRTYSSWTILRQAIRDSCQVSCSTTSLVRKLQ